MKIEIKGVPLARGIEYQESPFELKISGKRDIQEARFLGASQVMTFDRGNLKNRITFEVTRKHESLEKAIKHALLHSSDLEGLNGTVVFISEDANNESRFELRNASVSCVESRVNGLATFHRYEIIGGKFNDLQEVKLHGRV